MTYDFDRIVDRRSTESVKWRQYGDRVLPLWVADMDFPSPPAVLQALRARVDHGVFGYGLEPAGFFEVFADRLHKHYGWRVPEEALILLPGVIPGFNLACRALTTPGDGVLIQTPVYPPILRVPGNAAISRDETPLIRRPSGRYEIDFEAFEAAIQSRTRVFLLCNPHNPVGRVFERDELTRMAEVCLRRGLTICADEIHCDVLFQGHPHLPIGSLDPEVADRTITLMAPSKAFNLAGLKCSVAIVPNAGLRERFTAARADLVQSVNVLGLTAALAAYRDGQPWLEALLRYLEANRDLVVEYVRTRLPGVSIFPPEGTFLAWLDWRRAGISDPFTFLLERARVALIDGVRFGTGGEGFTRLNFGCPRSVLVEALDRMRQAMETAAP
jgi:cystathionine beta-lyase